MPNMTITDNDPSSVTLGGDETFRDELITFGGAATLLKGCLLARSTATAKLVPYVKGGVTAGNGIVNSVLTYAVTAAGAGDIKARVLILGTVNKSRLVINADGNASNIDGVVCDLLRDVGITPVEVQQLPGYDTHD